MIGAVVENIIGGYLQPRASARRLLNAGHGLEAGLTILALAFLVKNIFMIITPGLLPDTPIPILGRYFTLMISELIAFGGLASLICFVGRAFGGKATFEQTVVVLAWFELVTSILTPLVQPALLKTAKALQAMAAAPDEAIAIPAGPFLVLLVTSGLILWLLAAYTAELHGFAKTGTVLATVIGMLIPLSMLASAFVGLA